MADAKTEKQKVKEITDKLEESLKELFEERTGLQKSGSPGCPVLKRLKEALLKAKKEDGLEIKGKMRDVIAGLMHESSTGIARMESIQNHAIEEIKEELKNGNLGMCAEYGASRLSEDEQKKLADKVTGGENVQVKEVSEKVRKGGESVREQIADTYTDAMKNWVKENMGEPTKAAKSAIQKVSKLDTPQEDWSDIEWVVFMAISIMNRADCVSRKDLYSLHDIMVSCQSG